MWRVLVWWCVVRASQAEAGRVLAVFPAPGRARAALGDAAVDALLQAGHQVTYISPYSTLEPHAALTRVDISSVAEDDPESETLNLVERVRSPRPPQQVFEAGVSAARRALQHEAVRALLHDPALVFDVVLAEWLYSGLLAPLASLYECPLVWYSAGDASWMNLQLVHGQTSPAYSADPRARRLPAGYSLRERLERLRDQAYNTAWMYYMLYYVENAVYYEEYRKPLQLRARTPPSYEELVYGGSLLLLNSRPQLGQLVPLPPSAHYVGGHHIETPLKPLQKNFQQLLDNAKNGVIYINLGPDVKSSDLPDYMKMQLTDIFEQLDQTVVWEFEEPLEDLPLNVHSFDWTPKASILNHTNTILFITQGSLPSYMEAMYFGVPIVGIPILEEQRLTMELAQARGHGARVRYTEYLPHRLKDAITHVLANHSYRSNAKKASAMFRNPLVPPRKELVYWVELVMEHGAGHLRSPAVHLSMVERLYLDVAAVALMFCWFLTKVWKVILVYWNSDVEADKKNQ